VTLLTPLALLGLLLVPVIIAFYLLRLRRDERSVSSTYLWQQLVRDVQANAPWQRLRRSLLLLLQLIVVIVLAVLLARPTTERPAGLARDLVLVIDASASMSATDMGSDRLTAAKRAALDALRDLPADGRVSVVAAAETARVVANEATDRGRVARAIESIEPSTAPGQMADALKLAGELAERARGAEILVVTDDAASGPPDIQVEAPVRVVIVGQSRENQAIEALAVQADASGLKRTVFVSVANYSDSIVTRRLRILADGFAVTARDLRLAAVSRADVVIDELPPGTRVVQALIGPVEAEPAGAPADHLALDDSAWAVVPPDRLQRILLVGEGNAYIQTALSLLPNVELYGATPEDYPGTTGKDRFDLFVFDGYLPPELPDAPILAIAPPETSPLGTVTGTITGPAIGQGPPDEPLLRNVDLSRLHVAEAQRIELPEWARMVLPGGASSPLVYSGSRDGLPTTVIAFDLRRSDLPLQVAWPILASNIAGELLGLDATGVDPVAPGSPVELPLAPGVTALRVTRPDGSVVEVTAGASGASNATFVDTHQLGVYRVEPVLAPRASPSGGGSPSPIATPTPGTTPTNASTAPGSTPSPPVVLPDDPADTATFFAVDLFSKEESNIATGDGQRLVAIGGTAQPAGADPGVARDEWWPLLVAGVLALLLLEWAVYERDGARRLGNGMRRALAGLSLRRGRAS
jgi:hypothetical protein